MDNMTKILIVLIIFLATSIAGCASSHSDDGVDSGASKEDISVPADAFEAGVSVKALTPDKKDIDAGLINLAAYGILGIRCSSCDPVIKANATGVHDSPYVRAFVIKQGNEVAAFAVLDAPVIGNKYTRAIEKGVSVATGIPMQNVFISATHTHSGPDLFGYMGGVSDNYKNMVIDSTIDAIVEAFGSIRPVKLFVSQPEFKRDLIEIKNVSGEYTEFPDKDGKPQKWQYNRRGWPKRELEFSQPEWDSKLTVLEARDYKTGDGVFVMVNLASHAALVPDNTTEVTRDFCGYLVDSTENMLGGTPVIFMQGTMGDINPAFDMDVVMKELNSNDNPDDDIDLYEGAEVFGELIAGQAVAALENKIEISHGIHIGNENVDVNVDNPLMFTLITALGSKMQMDFDFNILSGYTTESRVNYVRLGNEVQIVTLPGEPATHLALGIKAGEHTGKDGKEIQAFKGIKPSMKASVKVICGLTSDTLIYMIPSVERLNPPDNMGGITSFIPYEEQMAVDSRIADKCRDAAVKLIDADKF